jgi:hypothetical protein
MAWRKTIDNFDPRARITGILSQFPAGKMTNPLNCSIEPHFCPRDLHLRFAIRSVMFSDIARGRSEVLG